MKGHVQEEVLERLRRRELPPEEIASALRHVAECPECAARASAQTTADTDRVRALLAAEAGEPPRHLDRQELFGWVDGTLDDANQRQVQEHLDECVLCREDVANLQPLRPRPARRQRRTWLAAAAAAAIVGTVLVSRDDRPPSSEITATDTIATSTEPPPRPQPAQYANAEWNELVTDTRTTGRLPYPNDLDDLRGEHDTLRGENGRAAAPLVPAGMVVDETRPRFSWPHTAGASYVVSVYYGDDEIARSETLRTNSWTPDDPLRRGRTYGWQVEVTAAGRKHILPRPEMPPARFRIVSQRDHDDLQAARAHYPADHFLLAVLYARAGMKDEAEEHLRQSVGR